MLSFLARVNNRLESEGVGRVIIVGGFAAELYSGGIYRTGGDIDVIIDSRDSERAMGILYEELGRINARREGRVWVSDYFGGVLALDVVGGVTYVGRVKMLRVGDGHVYVESPEDNVVTSLNACVYWSSDADCERAAAVLATQWGGNVDWNYLIDRARREGVLDKLNEIRRTIEERFRRYQEK
ncbi:nucleotidyltransferase family protein [Vulcanisaeta distributa]|uniref:nucleotidyltransferase family protein n=1 Tax=Vulcanisaeta distributa TaxID=164451 RepID=UPI000AE31165|nr:nucleotidyltransferase family protein [Vulcanisaeta distributa]